VSCYAVGSLESVWQRIETDGHILVDETQNGLNRLEDFASDKLLHEFERERESTQLLCGACIGLDFSNARSNVFIEKLEVATKHFSAERHPDEVYATLVASELGMKSTNDLFQSGIAEAPSSVVIRHAYDIPHQYGTPYVGYGSSHADVPVDKTKPFGYAPPSRDEIATSKARLIAANERFR
jgi:hypothetical protein